MVRRPAERGLVAVVVLLFWGFILTRTNLGSLETPAVTQAKRATTATNISKASKENAANSALGERSFAGTRVRKFRGHRRSDKSSSPLLFWRKKENKEESAASLQQWLTNQTLYRKCEKWAVITSTYSGEPSEAIVPPTVQQDWCIVVVVDSTTSVVHEADSAKDQVAFLHISELAQHVPFVARTPKPFDSFARKNIGYLYAIWMGAAVILDVDNDNLVDNSKNATNSGTLIPGTNLLEQYTNTSSNLLMVKHISMSDAFEGRAFNPFPVMGAAATDAWPRGFPLSLTHDKESRGQPGPLLLKEVQRSNIAAIQSVCDNNPDVDAKFRLGRSPLLSFEPAKANTHHAIEIPRNQYTPYNAQATLHYPMAFWGLYLPITVTSRVSDIWRSYIVQRLLRELAQASHVLYSPSILRAQIHNGTMHAALHDYAAEYEAEQHLYQRTEALLAFLDQWKPPQVDKDSLQARIEDLWIALYEREFVELKDVQAIQRWLDALEQGGYVFPKVRDHKRDFDVSTGGVEARKECARQRLEHWEEPVPTFANGMNYGALKLQQQGHAPQKSIARILAEYELEHSFPHSIDLLCRAGGHHAPHELAVWFESVQLYWPKCAGRVVLVLDRGDEEFAHENIPEWIDVMYSEFSYAMPGRLGNQLFNMYSDQQGRSEYVAIIDSDTTLTTPVTPDLVFNLNKRDEAGRVPPYIMADKTWQKGYWTKGDDWMFQGDSNDWNFMIRLPLVWPRAMFPQYRAGVEAIHNNEFETTDLWQHFRTTVRLGWMSMSQFCLLGNWLVRHWKDRPIDLRLVENGTIPILFGVHMPYHKGLRFNKNDPASYQAAGRHVIAVGVCELFCWNDPSITGREISLATMPALETCSSLCPDPVPFRHDGLFKYNTDVFGTMEQRNQTLTEHFQPFQNTLAFLAQQNVTTVNLSEHGGLASGAVV